MSFVYLFEISEIGLCKIGVSADPNKRKKQLQTASAYKIQIICIFKSNFAFKVEKILHSQYEHCKYDLDNFNIFEGEWYKLNESDKISFCDLCSQIEQNLLSLKESNNHFF